MAYNTQKPERFAQDIIDAAALAGLTVVKSYTATNDIYLTFTDPVFGGADCLLKIIMTPVTGSNIENPVTMLASEVYVPHILQVGYSGMVKADNTATLTGQTVGTHSAANVILASVIVTDAVTVNGVPFTCVAGAPGIDQFRLGTAGPTQDALTAINLAAAINGSNSAGILNTVYAEVDSVNAKKVNLFAITPGVAGDALTLATLDLTITVSGATFANGADADSLVLNGIGFEVVDVALPVKPYEVVAGLTDAATIAALVAKINAVFNGVTATVDGIVPEQANLKATVGGTAGNLFTLADGGVGGFAVGAATFANGSDTTSSTLVRAATLLLGYQTGVTTDLYECEGTFIDASFVAANFVVSFRNQTWGNLVSM
jgi:hypothetical protein